MRNRPTADALWPRLCAFCLAAALLADSLFETAPTRESSVESIDPLVTSDPQPVATLFLEAPEDLFDQSMDNRQLSQTAGEDWSLDGDLLDLLAINR